MKTIRATIQTFDMTKQGVQLKMPNAKRHIQSKGTVFGGVLTLAYLVIIMFVTVDKLKNTSKGLNDIITNNYRILDVEGLDKDAINSTLTNFNFLPVIRIHSDFEASYQMFGLKHDKNHQWIEGGIYQYLSIFLGYQISMTSYSELVLQMDAFMFHICQDSDFNLSADTNFTEALFHNDDKSLFLCPDLSFK